jgi:hypothetical protein
VLTQVVAGDGGTGKTQLAAAAFRAALADSRPVELAVWVTAVSRAAVVSAYTEAYADTHPRAGGGDAEDQAGRFLGWLAGTGRRWLVVLDDLADPAAAAGLWPEGPAGRVLVTTRRRDAAVPGQAAVINVGVFTGAEAAAYLSAKLSGVSGLPARVLDEVEGLAEDLGRLPLALAHAAAVIINDGITCVAYRGLLSDRTRPLTEIFPATPGQAGDEYAHTVAGTWSLARQRAQALDPAGLAGPMLDLISVLDPNGIPETVLTSGPARTYLRAASAWAWAKHGRVSVEDARRTLRNLRRLSLISHDPDDEIRGVRIHALAQRAGIEALDQAALATTIRTAADALRAAWPGGGHHHRTRADAPRQRGRPGRPPPRCTLGAGRPSDPVPPRAQPRDRPGLSATRQPISPGLPRPRPSGSERTTRTREVPGTTWRGGGARRGIRPGRWRRSNSCWPAWCGARPGQPGVVRSTSSAMSSSPSVIRFCSSVSQICSGDWCPARLNSVRSRQMPSSRSRSRRSTSPSV